MRVQVLLFLAAVVAAVGAKSLTGEKEVQCGSLAEYYSYRTALREKTSFADKLRILDEVWTEILDRYPADRYKPRTLYKEFSAALQDMTDATVSDVKAATTLHDQIAEHVRNESSRHVAAILRDAEYPIEEDLQYLMELNRLPAEIRKMIFEMAIDEAFHHGKAQQLAAHFDYWREQLPAMQKTATEAQLYLYWKFLGQRQTNDLYLFNVAYYLLQTNGSRDFASWPQDLQLAVRGAVDTLPKPLRYLYFERNFCLLNKAYSEFMYTANIQLDRQHAHILTWIPESPVDAEGIFYKHITAFDNKDTTQLSIKFNLKSWKFNKYMQRADVGLTDQVFAAWSAVDEVPENSGLTVKYQDGALVFRQNGYLMCASNQLFDKERRKVLAYQDDEHTSATAACQWIAGECGL